MKDFVCNGCSLLCNDVSATIEKNEVSSLGVCKLGHAHLTSAASEAETGIVRRNGEEKRIPIEDAIKETARVLSEGENILVYGWTTASNESIKHGQLLAEELNAHFNTLASLSAYQSMSHELHSMTLAIDLDYIRNNGEFIIYWGCNPAESLHRHPSRFAVLPIGDKLPEGVESRTIGVVDVRETETMKMANHRFKIPIGQDVDLLKALASELKGTSSITEPLFGIPAVEILGLVRAFKKSDCTVIFYGSGLVNSGNAEENLSALLNLIEVLKNDGKEAYALPMFPESNIMGALQETKKQDSQQSILTKIANGEFDTALIVGDDVFSEIPGRAAKALRKSKIVYIGRSGGLTDSIADISIHTTDPIISGASTMIRIDLKKYELVTWNAEVLTIDKVLGKIHELVKK